MRDSHCVANTSTIIHYVVRTINLSGTFTYYYIIFIIITNFLLQGGTIIGSARCMEFLEKSGRRKAAKNLIQRGIMNLVVIGGDGSLTGANLFREEWPEHVEHLKTTGTLT